MTKVRKQAMGSYLQKEHRKPKQTAQGQRSRLHSEDSTGSRSSVGSEQQETIDDVLSAQDVLAIFRGEKRRPSRRPSSPIRSPASSGTERQAVVPDTQISRIPPTLDIMSSAPIVQPMRTGIKLPFMTTKPRPFQSIGKPLDPFRAMFQASDHRVSVEFLKFHCQ